MRGPIADYLTVSQAASLKGVLPGTVRRRIERGALPAIKLGAYWLIQREDLDAWTVQTKQAVSRDA